VPRSNYEDATEPGAHAMEDGKVAEPLLQRGEVPKDPRTNTSPPGSENNDVDAAATGPAATTSPKPVVDLADGVQARLDSEKAEHPVSLRSFDGTKPRPLSPTQITSSHHLAIPSTTRRSKSPITLPPVATIPEPQSSPTSANGAASHDTPTATAESPDTSPGADEAPVSMQDFQKSKPSEDLTPPDSTDNGVTDSRPDDTPTDKVTADVESMAMEVDPPNKPEAVAESEKPARDVDFKRPSMRIDTQSSIQSFGTRSGSGSNLVESPNQMTGTSTPRKTPTATYISQDQTKRATRISSGALERKSVSEILGDTPKVSSPHVDRSALMTPSSASRDEFMQTSSAGRLAERDRREKERERSKLSTVVFAKAPQSSDDTEPAELTQRSPSHGLGSPKERDYLYTLFESRAYSSRNGHTLGHLLGSAHKTLTTADHLVEYQEAMDCRTLKRIYQLQNANRWPLRQVKRAEEPPRPTSSWDFLLDHAKWLREDFRQERKWKMAAAAGVAAWCAEWVLSSDEERKALQVRVKPHKGFRTRIDEGDEVMHDDSGPALESSQSPPALTPSGEDESTTDAGVADPRDLALTMEPAAIFSLGPNDFNFMFQKTPAAEKLLQELPLYRPAEIVEDLSKSDLAERRDAVWKKELCPVSRFAEGKITVRQRKPPSKRSRYDYDLEDSPKKDSTALPPEQTNVALFMPENKHTRDRIHPGHSFRPPSEHPMPTQSFFECRTSSQWTQSEDDELRRLVKDYSYNWSLIASCLSPKSLFFSGADRRTPWECFERWTGLEGLPQEMQKTPYFRAYHGRIENAARHNAAQYEAAQRATGNNQLPPRRRTTAPVRVERKRTQRYLAMLDGMRKLAKKRETALQKQQHAADLAATRKMNEANQPKPPVRTPAEFSQLKHEREIRSAERAEQYRQQLFAQRQQAAQQARQAGGQFNGVPNVPRLPGQVPNGVPGVNGIPSMPNGNMPGAPNGQARPNTGLQPGPNGMAQMPPHIRGGASAQASPAQMQAQLALAQQRLVGQSLSPEQMRMQTEAIKAQQQQLLLARQAQMQQGVNGSHSSPNLPNAAMANGQGGQAAYMAALATANGMPSPSVQMNGNATSPRSNAANMGGQPLSSGPIPVIQQLTAKIRAENPNMSSEEAQQHATSQMMAAQQNYQAQTQKRNQAAHNAAMGAANAGQVAANAAAYAQAALNPQVQPPPMMSNEAVQAYNQRMRQTQQALLAQQRQTMAAGLGPNGMMPSMTGSPILNMARPVSQHSRSATPRERSGSHNGLSVPGQGSPRNGQIQMQS
jgi:chromatin modification-related protein VID21